MAKYTVKQLRAKAIKTALKFKALDDLEVKTQEEQERMCILAKQCLNLCNEISDREERNKHKIVWYKRIAVRVLKKVTDSIDYLHATDMGKWTYNRANNMANRIFDSCLNI